ncbi:peptidase S41 [Geomonas sp. Red276]
MTTKRTALTALTAIVVLSLLIVLLVPMIRHLGGGGRSDAEYLNMFKEVVEIVRTSYVDKVDDKKLMTGAINGMLSALDPHSVYLPLTDYTEMKVHMAGEFGGLGIQLEMIEGKLIVNAPIEDTPAFRAGIQAGDQIVKIDNKFVKGLKIDECVSRMRGTPGTKVTLTILRKDNPPLTFPLIRAIIKTKSLKAKLLEQGYGYIRISEFQEHTGEDFRHALETLKADNGAQLSGLILDLRYNPGGLVDQAVMVADRFIGEGLNTDGLIVTTKGREESSQRSMMAYVGEKEPHYPMVVLINGGSASASEIVAGALQDHKRAVIMGTQSFGKGSVQSIITLPNGDGLKLTTARYYTPSGRSIQARGIKPDIVVEFQRKPVKPVKEHDKDDDLREQDLDGHIMAPADDQTKTQAPAKEPSNPHQNPMTVKPIPHGTIADIDIVKADNQVARALDLLKGVNLLKATGR